MRGALPYGDYQWLILMLVLSVLPLSLVAAFCAGMPFVLSQIGAPE